MRLRRAIRHNSLAELPRSTARIQIPMNLAIVVVKGVITGKRALPLVRATECPAYGHCYKRDHFESICRGKSAGREDSKYNTEAVFQSLCAVTEHFSPLYSVTILDQNPGRRAISIDHHVYDQLSNMWLRRSSESQPYTMLTVTPSGKTMPT